MSAVILMREIAFCCAATLSFAILFRAPSRTLPVSAVIAGLGWIAYRAMGSALSAYFFAAFGIAILGEVSARIFKKPATLYIHVAVIPLVPGAGLYQTMLYLVNGDTAQGLAEGARTLLAIGLIAMAIGVASLLVKYLSRSRKKARAV